jgi:hypothetical protein
MHNNRYSLLGYGPRLYRFHVLNLCLKHLYFTLLPCNWFCLVCLVFFCFVWLVGFEYRISKHADNVKINAIFWTYISRTEVWWLSYAWKRAICWRDARNHTLRLATVHALCIKFRPKNSTDWLSIPSVIYRNRGCWASSWKLSRRGFMLYRYFLPTTNCRTNRLPTFYHMRKRFVLVAFGLSTFWTSVSH